MTYKRSRKWLYPALYPLLKSTPPSATLYRIAAATTVLAWLPKPSPDACNTS